MWINWIIEHSIAITEGQCLTHGAGRFIPNNNLQALTEKEGE